MNKDEQNELAIPDNLDNETKVLYAEIMESIRESSKRARGAILNERGYTVWQEPLAEYEQRMKVVDGMECIKKKPSPPPPPPMRKYKTSGFLGIDVLVNQDEIDAHRELMDKWREENLK